MKTHHLALTLLAVSACGPDYAFDTTVTGLGSGTYSELTGFGSNPGAIKGFQYVPPTPPTNAPLVLALHACSQTATEYRKAGWEELADELGFYVLYPEQQTGNNALRCFNWAGEYGNPTNLMRGQGENASIKQMVDAMLAAHSIDPNRVYLSGHSGGAAQVNLMLAVYPDVFAGGASIAGIPYNCTTTFTEVSTCLSPGIDKTPMDWGDRARAGFAGYAGPWPKISVWHGTADSTVRPLMGAETIEQWTNVHGIDLAPDTTETVDGHTREVHLANGQEVIEFYRIQGMGHGTPVVPADGCGQAGAFFLDSGICSARRIAEFFGIDGGAMPGDRTPPTVNVTAPANGAMVSSVATITVAASDDVGVDRVEISINGTLETTLRAAPYTYSWSLTGLANGAYSISAAAFDAAGNTASDNDTTVTVTGGVDDTTAPTIQLLSPVNGAEVSGMVMFTANATDDFGVARVEYEVDGAPAGSATASPYQVTWNAGSVAEGMHTILARAVDAAGNTADTSIMVSVVASAAVDSTPPTVSITSPANGATVGGVVTVTADAMDDVAMNQVLLFLGQDQLIAADYRDPYEFLVDLNAFPEGSAQLTARAFDAAGNLSEATVMITIRHEEEMQMGEPVLLGKKRWGCTAMPSAAESGAWFVLLGAGILLSRRRRRLAVVALLLLGACSGEDLYGNGVNNDAGAYSTASKIDAYLDGKMLTMSGAQIPTHPNGYDENVNFGQASQCYHSVEMAPSAGRVTVVSQLGTLMNADEVGDMGTCDRTRLSNELTFVSTAFIINNVRGNGECFDFTVTYPGFAQEGRGEIAEDGSQMTLELFFKDQALGHRCADGDVGDPTVTLSQNAFTGNALQVYSIQ